MELSPTKTLLVANRRRLLVAMRQNKAESGFDALFLAVVDIVNLKSTLLLCSECVTSSLPSECVRERARARACVCVCARACVRANVSGRKGWLDDR